LVVAVALPMDPAGKAVLGTALCEGEEKVRKGKTVGREE